MDHYKCYGILVAKAPRGEDPFPKFTPFNVELEDQFGATTVAVKKPTLLCHPVDKNGEGIKNPAGHLLCYQITRATPGSAQFRGKVRVFLHNQFGPEVLDVTAVESLCVPSSEETEGLAAESDPEVNP